MRGGLQTRATESTKNKLGFARVACVGLSGLLRTPFRDPFSEKNLGEIQRSAFASFSSMHKLSHVVFRSDCKLYLSEQLTLLQLIMKQLVMWSESGGQTANSKAEERLMIRGNLKQAEREEICFLAFLEYRFRWYITCLWENFVMFCSVFSSHVNYTWILWPPTLHIVGSSLAFCGHERYFVKKTFLSS